MRTVGIDPIGANPISIRPVGITPISVSKLGVYNPYRYSQRLWSSQERQHVKDLGDIYFGDANRGTLQLRHTLEDAGYSHLIGAPYTSRIMGYYLMMKERYVDPTLAGKPHVMLLNALETFGYTMDTLSNPVKSLFTGAGGGKAGDFARSMGWIENEYRKQFQYNSGSFVVDVTKEMLSDPTFVAGLIKNALVKIPTKAASEFIEEVSQKTVRELVKQAPQEVAEETIEKTSKRIARQWLREYMKNSNTFVDEAVKYIERDATLRKLLTDVFGTVVDPDTGREFMRFVELDDILKETLTSDLSKIFRTSYYKQYKTIRKAFTPVDKLDKGLVKVATYMTPLGPSTDLYKHALVPTAKAISNQAKKMLSTVKLEEILDNAPGTLKRVSDKLFFENQKMHKEVYDKWDSLLKVYNINVEALQRLYVSILHEVPVERHDSETITRLFIERLEKVAPGINKLLAEDLAESLAESVANEVDALVRCISEVGDEVYKAQLVIQDQVFRAVVKDMEVAFSKSFADMTLAETLEHINKNYLKIGGKAYGFDKIDELIIEINKIPIDEKNSIMNVLNYFGITLDNAKELAELYKYKEKNYLDKVKALLEKGKTGSINIYREIEKIKGETYQGIKQALGVPSNPKMLDAKNILHLFEKARITSGALTEAEKLLKSQEKLTTFLMDEFYPGIEDFVKTFAEDGELETALKNVEDVLKDTRLIPTYADSVRLLKEIKQLAKFKNKKPTMKSIKKIAKLIESISLKTYGLAKLLDDAGGVPELSPLKTFVNNLRGMSFNYTKTGIEDSVLESIETLQTLYHLILSKEGMFHWIDLEVFDESLADLGTWFKELINTESTTRASVIELTKTLEKEGAEEIAYAIRRLLATIDNHTQIRLLLGSSLPGVEEELANFIRGAMFNAVVEKGNKFTSNCFGSVREMVNKIMKIIKATYLDSIEDEVIRRATAENPDLVQFLDTASKQIYQLGDELPSFLFTDQQFKRAYFAINNAIETQTFTNQHLKQLKAYLLKHADNVDESIIDSLFDLLRLKDKSTYYSIELQLREMFNNAMNNHIHYSEDLIKHNIKTYFNVEEAIAKELLRLESMLYDTLNAYMKSNYRAGNKLGFDMPMYLPFSQQSIIMIKNIAQEKDRIIESASDASVYRELEMFAKVFGAEPENIEFLNKALSLIDAIEQGVDYSVLQSGFTELADRESVAKRILHAFRQISIQNKYLTGTVKARDNLDKIINFYTYQELDNVIKNANRNANIYTWSTANRWYTFKKIVDERFLEEMGEAYTKEVLGIKSNLDYIHFMNAIERGLERHRNLIQSLTPYRYDVMRENLIETYSRTGLPFGPEDAHGYFFSMSDDQIYAWHYATKNHTDSMIRKAYQDSIGIVRENAARATQEGVIKRRSLREIRNYKQNPEMYYDAIDSVANDLMFIEPGAWEELVYEAPTQGAMEQLYENVNMELRSLLTSTENLTKYNYAYTKWIEEDVEALGRLNYITEIEESLIAEGKTEDEIKQVMRKVYKERKEWQAKSIINFSARELRSYLDYETDGAFMFVNIGLGLDTYTLFNFTEEEMLEHGFKVVKLPDHPVYIIMRTDNVVRPRVKKPTYLRMKKTSQYEWIHNLFDKLFEENRNYMNMDGMTTPSRLLTGESVDIDFWDFVVEQFPELAGTRKTWQNVTSTGTNNFYSKKFNRPNTSIIGGHDAYNYVLGVVEGEAVKQGRSFFYKPKELNKVAQASMIDYIQRANKLHKYASMFFNDNYFLGNKQFEHIFKNKTDKEIAEFFTRFNYTGAILKRNKRGQIRVYKYHITSRKALQEAIEQGAICVPDMIYKNMVMSINKKQVDNKLINLYRRTIVGTYKSIWLFSAGYLFRNATDSLFYKNLNEVGGITGLPDLLKYERQASKILAWYNKIQQEILEEGVAPEILGTPEMYKHMTLNKNKVLKRLANLSSAERELYMLVDMFVQSGANGGFSKAFEDFLIGFNKAYATADVEYKWAKYWNERILHHSYSPVKKVQDINSWIEQSARFGLFLNLIDNGVEHYDAIKRVITTHFDYNYKNTAEDLMEHLFWFSTFPINNVAYFANGGLEKSPDLLKLHTDVWERSWNSDEYPLDYIKRSNYLSYHATIGNIRIGNKVIKTGSSVFDFFQLMLNPMGEMKDRLNPFLATIMGMDDPAQLNMLNAQMNRVGQMTRGESLIPSIYSPIFKLDRRPYKGTYHFRRTWNKYPTRTYIPKPRKIRRLRYYRRVPNYGYAIRTYRTNVKYNWKGRTQASVFLSPTWTPSDRVYRSIERLRRYSKGRHRYR